MTLVITLQRRFDYMKAIILILLLNGILLGQEKPRVFRDNRPGQNITIEYVDIDFKENIP